MSIVITPGITNPVATPGQTMGFFSFPRTPVQNTSRPRLSLQWATGRVEEEAVSGFNINFASFDFVTGELAIGLDVATFDAGIANFSPAGARYVPDGTYAKTGFDSPNKTYFGTGAGMFTPAGMINLGTVEAQYGGDFELPSNGIRILLDYLVTVDGDGDGATYALSVLGSGTPTAASGTITLGLAYPVNPASNGFIDQDLDAILNFAVTLLRDGQPFDQIFMAIPVTGTVVFTMIPLSPGASLPIPEVETGQTFTDTVFGATAVDAAGTVPGIPWAGYLRRSRASQGEVVLS